MTTSAYIRRLLIFSTILCSANVATAQQTPVEIDTLERSYEAELPRIPPREPSKALETFQIDKRFQLEQIAAEPLVSDPVAMAFDEFGRLFVVEMRGYSEDEKDNLGVVRLLEDTDGDGVMDKSQIFLDGLSWPTAIACYKGGVFVGVAPDIIYCPDKNRDGVADKTEVIFSGFKRNNVQGILNSFIWGLDNYLYGSGSSNGGDLRMTKHPDAPIVKLRRNDFRIDVDTRKIEAITGGGQHGMSFDRWGDRFVCSNSDHIQSIRFEQKVLARNPTMSAVPTRTSIAADGASAPVFRSSRVEPWRIVRTRLRVKKLVGGPIEGGGRPAGYFTSATGITVYQGDAFPAEFMNATYAFMGDVGSNLVHCKKIEDDGLTKTAYRMHENSEFLTSTDNWFRPVQFANGPDGALHVIDMYRETIEHPLSLPPIIKKHLDLTSGRKRGRIYRIVRKDFQQPTRQLPGNATLDQLVTMLGHPNGWHRQTAARLLFEKRDEASFDLLHSTLSKSEEPIAKIHALYLLNAFGILTGKEISAALANDHSFVQEHAIRLAQENLNQKSEWLSSLRSLTDSSNPRVLRQLAISLGYLDWPESKDVWIEIASTTAIHVELRHALLSSAAGHQTNLFSELIKRDAPVDSNLLFDLVDQISRRRKLPEIVSTVRLANESTETMRDALLARIFGSLGQPGDSLTARLGNAGLNDAKSIVQSFLERSLSTALDDAVDVQSRVTAISRLVIAPSTDVERVVDRLLSSAQPESIQSAVVELIRRIQTKEIAETVVERLPSLSPNAKRSSFSLILSRRDWTSLLLDKIEADEISPTLLFATDRQRLLTHANSAIRKRAVAVFGAQQSRSTVVKMFRDVLTMTGEINQGQQLFKTKCSVCHKLGTEGNHVGPDLQPLRNRGAEFFLTNILDPNREVDPRYESYVAATTKGQTFSGIIRSDHARAITLVQADAKEQSIDREEIDQLSATGKSLMPEGFEKEFTSQQLADLIAYLVFEP